MGFSNTASSLLWFAYAFCLVVRVESFTARQQTKTLSRFPRQDVGLQMIDPDSTLMATTMASSMVGLLEQAAQSYTYCLEEYHLPTQLATAAVCSAGGDILAQKTSSSNEEYDPTRTLKFFLKGLGGGLMWDYWYSMSDQVSLDVTNAILTPEVWMNSISNIGSSANDFMLEAAAAATATATAVEGNELAGVASSVITNDVNNNNAVTRVVMSIVLEQILVAPVFYTFWDIPVPALLNGSPVRQMPAQVKAKLRPLLWANFKVWTPMNIIIYTLPSEYRLLFSSFADLIWQIFNSQITTQDIVIESNANTMQPQARPESVVTADTTSISSQRLKPVVATARDD